MRTSQFPSLLCPVCRQQLSSIMKQQDTSELKYLLNPWYWRIALAWALGWLCLLFAIQSRIRPIATNLDLLARVTASTQEVPQMSQSRLVIAAIRQAVHFPFFSKHVLLKVKWPLKHLLTSWSCISLDCCEALWGPQGEKSYRTAHIFGVLLLLLLCDYIIFSGVLSMVEITIVCNNYTYCLFPNSVKNFVNVSPDHLASFLFSSPLNTSF